MDHAAWLRRLGQFVARRRAQAPPELRRGRDVRRWRRLLFGVMALAGLAGAALLLWPSPGRPAPSLKALARLAPGMTEAQVAALLGPPAADVTGAPPPGVPPAAPGGR